MTLVRRQLFPYSRRIVSKPQLIKQCRTILPPTNISRCIDGCIVVLKHRAQLIENRQSFFRSQRTVPANQMVCQKVFVVGNFVFVAIIFSQSPGLLSYRQAKIFISAAGKQKFNLQPIHG